MADEIKYSSHGAVQVRSTRVICLTVYQLLDREALGFVRQRGELMIERRFMILRQSLSPEEWTREWLEGSSDAAAANP